MSDADKKGTTARNVPEWEAELWSYVSHGDGTRCPLRDSCVSAGRHGWCPEEDRERLSRLLDEKEFDLRNYDFVESQGIKHCRIIQLIEILAGRYLKSGQVLCPPVSTRIVASFDSEHDIEIRQLLLKAYHGAIWKQKDDWVIQVNKADSPSTKRFTIFHEAFHILAYTKTTPVFRKRGSLLGSFNEWLADHFAFCILMPREWVLRKWIEVGNLEEMANAFAVPKSAMCLRLRQLGLL